MIADRTTYRKIKNLNPNSARHIQHLLVEQVMAWINKNGSVPFAAHDLVGKSEMNWQETPLQELYDRYIRMDLPHSIAFAQGGKDLGWLLKEAIRDIPQKTFSMDYKGRVRSYSVHPE